MPGHAAAIAPIVDDGASIRVPVLGQGKPVQLIDARPKLHWTEAEVEQAVETQQKRAGALVALVRERSEATWSELRRELNEAAGGQASARVMVLAHHALRAHQALELQTLLAEMAAGEETKGADNGLRNQSGLSVIATQALNQAFEAARTEAGKRTSPTEQLMAKLGHGAPLGAPVQGGSVITHGSLPPVTESVHPDWKVGAQSPVQPPGGVAIGSPHAAVSHPSGESE